MINKPIIYKFFKDFTNPRRKTNGTVVFIQDFSPTFLNTGTTCETFQQSAKQDSFRSKLKSSATMYVQADTSSVCSGSYFLRTTTEIQSGSDAFEKSKLLMANLGDLYEYYATSG